MKKRAPKEKTSVFNFFGSSSSSKDEKDDEDDGKDNKKEKASPEHKEMEQMMLAKHKETWDSLDAAKKKRRLQEFLKVHLFLLILSFQAIHLLLLFFFFYRSDKE